MKKKIMENHGPGMYYKSEVIIPKENIPAYQYFGSTTERECPELKAAAWPGIGPGLYETKQKQKEPFNTASFMNSRGENLFSVIQGMPGPHEYDVKETKLKNKFWSSSVQAFGKTERRFAFSTSVDSSQDSQMLAQKSWLK